MIAKRLGAVLVLGLSLAFPGAGFAGGPVHLNTSNGLPDDFVTAIFVRTAEVLVGTASGLASVDNDGRVKATHVLRRGSSGSVITGLCEQPDGTVLVAAAFGDGGGLYRYSGRDLARLETSPPLESRLVTAVARRGRDVAVATFGAGLFLLQGRTLRKPPIGAALPDRYLTALAIDGPDLWIGTRDHGAVLWTGDTLEVFDDHSSEIPNNSITAIAVRSTEADATKEVWFGTHGGASRFRRSSAKPQGEWVSYFRAGGALPDPGVRDIALSGSRAYLATGAGVGVFDGKEFKTWNEALRGLPSNLVLALALDPTGRLWLGTDKGLLRLGDL